MAWPKSVVRVRSSDTAPLELRMREIEVHLGSGTAFGTEIFLASSIYGGLLSVSDVYEFMNDVVLNVSE